MTSVCINCGNRAAGTYDIVLPEDTNLSDVPLCHDCHTAFFEVDWIDLDPQYPSHQLV